MSDTVRFTTNAQLENWCGYHPPANTDVAEAHELIRAQALATMLLLQGLLPEGPDKTVAFRAAREAMWSANAALACNADDTYRIPRTTG